RIDSDAFELQPEPWFEPQPEPEPLPELESAVAPTTVPDPDSLKHLITQHDLAVAESSFRPAEQEPAAPPPVPTPALRPAAAAESDVQTLSSSLIEASLIALAAVLATRLLQAAD